MQHVRYTQPSSVWAAISAPFGLCEPGPWSHGCSLFSRQVHEELSNCDVGYILSWDGLASRVLPDITGFRPSGPPVGQ